MTYDPRKHHRRSIRLKGYDYTQPGAYFITICVQNRENLLGEIVGEDMRLNDWGQIIAEEWAALPQRFPHTGLDETIIMPNHFHAILHIRGGEAGENQGGETPPLLGTGAVSAPPVSAPPPIAPPPPGSLGQIMAYFKYQTTKRINLLRQMAGTRLWQRNYYEHIIRNDRELHAIRAYIRNNPLKWALDRDNLHNARRLPPPTTIQHYLTDL